MFYLPVFILILPACKFTQLTQFVGWLIYMSVVGILGIVRMLVCAGACVCVCECVRACVRACVRVYVLRIVSRDKILRFKILYLLVFCF